MTVSTTPPVQGQKLPVLETTGEIFREFFRHIRKLPQAAIWPFVLSLPILAIEIRIGDESSWLLLFYLPHFAIYTLFAIAWHRLVLLGDTPRSGPAAWSKAHTAFLGYIFLVIFVPMFVFTVLVFATTAVVDIDSSGQDHIANLAVILLGILAAIAGVFYLIAIVRWSFVFPARAVGEKYGLRDSWRHTKGNFWRLVGIYLLVSLPCLAIAYAIFVPIIAIFLISAGGGVEISEPAVWITLVSTVVAYGIFYIVYTALAVTILSISFRKATNWIPPAAAPVTVDTE